MRVLILANGEPPPPKLALRLAQEHDVVVFVDGAARSGATIGLTPHVVSGDFDSIPAPEAIALFPSAEIVVTANQDKGDLEKAIDLSLERGATRITIVGAAGGRIDHLLANHLLLARFATVANLCIVDAWSEVRAVAGARKSPTVLTLETDPGDTISLIPICDEVHVSLTGVKWPLHKAALTYGTLGISNEATSPQVEIEVQGGGVLVCRVRVKERT